MSQKKPSTEGSASFQELVTDVYDCGLPSALQGNRAQPAMLRSNNNNNGLDGRHAERSCFHENLAPLHQIYLRGRILRRPDLPARERERELFEQGHAIPASASYHGSAACHQACAQHKLVEMTLCLSCGITRKEAIIEDSLASKWPDWKQHLD